MQSDPVAGPVLQKRARSRCRGRKPHFRDAEFLKNPATSEIFCESLAPFKKNPGELWVGDRVFIGLFGCSGSGVCDLKNICGILQILVATSKSFGNIRAPFPRGWTEVNSRK
jgi:hypothetical protein